MQAHNFDEYPKLWKNEKFRKAKRIYHTCKLFKSFNYVSSFEIQLDVKCFYEIWQTF